MEFISQVYLALFLIGLVYAIIAGIMSGLASGEHGDTGSHDTDGHHFHAEHPDDFQHETGEVGEHETSGAVSPEHDSLTLDAGADGGVSLTPVSPVTIATFITCFGGTGLVAAEVFKFPLFLSLPGATISGFIIAGSVLWGFNKIFSATQSSSEARVSTLTGLEAEVITPIPAEGIGEIAYVSRGTRFTGPARSMLKNDISKNAQVVITKIIGSTFYVLESVDEELRNVE